MIKAEEEMLKILDRKKREREIISNYQYITWLEQFINKNGNINTNNLPTLNEVDSKMIKEIRMFFMSIYFEASKSQINIDKGECIVLKTENNYYKIGYHFINGIHFYIEKVSEVENCLDFDLIVNKQKGTIVENIDFRLIEMYLNNMVINDKVKQLKKII